MFPEGLPPQLNRNKGLKSLDPMTTGAELRKTSDGILKHIRKTSDPVLDSFFIWNRILTAYMDCSLTKDEDRLVAISAITKSIQPLVNDTYLAGLWLRHLPYHLLWRLQSPAPVWCTPGESRSFIAPSWSWASARGPCDFFNNINIHQERFMIRILETKVVPKGPDPMGQLLYASIKLHCWLKSFSFREIRFSDTWLDFGQKDLKLWTDFDEEPGQYGRKLFFMPILKCPDENFKGSNVVHGLILSETGNRAEFHRVGMFNSSSFWCDRTYQLFKRPTFGSAIDNCQGENITAHSTPLEDLIIDENDDLDDESDDSDDTSSGEEESSSGEEESNSGEDDSGSEEDDSGSKEDGSSNEENESSSWEDELSSGEVDITKVPEGKWIDGDIIII